LSSYFRWFLSKNAVISLAKAQSTPRQAINILLKQSVDTLRALRLGESQLFWMETRYVVEEKRAVRSLIA
jgi:hypothetical protein